MPRPTPPKPIDTTNLFAFATDEWRKQQEVAISAAFATYWAGSGNDVMSPELFVECMRLAENMLYARVSGDHRGLPNHDRNGSDGYMQAAVVGKGIPQLLSRGWHAAYSYGSDLGGRALWLDPIDPSYTPSDYGGRAGRQQAWVAQQCVIAFCGGCGYEMTEDDKYVRIVTPLGGTSGLTSNWAHDLRLSKDLLSFLQRRYEYENDPVAFMLASHEGGIAIADADKFNYLMTQNDGTISFLTKSKGKALYDPWEQGNGRQSMKPGRFVKAAFTQEWLDHFSVKDPQVETFANAYVAHCMFTGKIEVVTGEMIRYWYDEANYQPNTAVLKNSCMRYGKDQGRMGMYVGNPEQIGLIIATNPETNKLIGRSLLWTDEHGQKFYDRVYAEEKTVEAVKTWAEKQGWRSVRSYTPGIVKLDNPWHDSYPYIDYMNQIDGNGWLYPLGSKPRGAIHAPGYNNPGVPLKPGEVCPRCTQRAFSHTYKDVDGIKYCETCSQYAWADLVKAISLGTKPLPDTISYALKRRLHDHGMLMSVMVGVHARYWYIMHASNGKPLVEDRYYVTREDRSGYEELVLVDSDKAKATIARFALLSGWAGNLLEPEKWPENPTITDFEDVYNMAHYGQMSRISKGYYHIRKGTSERFVVKFSGNLKTYSLTHEKRLGMDWVLAAEYDTKVKERVDRIKARVLNMEGMPSIFTSKLPTFKWDGRDNAYAELEQLHG